MSESRTRLPMAIPWYSPEEWNGWKAISIDPMCESHESWLKGAEDHVKDLTKNRIEVHCVKIGLAEFNRWASSRKLECNGYTRGEFALFKLSRRLLQPDPRDSEIPTSAGLKELLRKMKGLDTSEIWEPYLRRPKSAICPLMRDSNGRVEQFASGVLVKIGDAHFLLSAAHVGDEMERDGVLVPFKDEIGYVDGSYGGTRMPSTGDRRDDRFDVFYFRLEPHVVESLHDDFLFLDAIDCDTFDTTSEGDVYTLIGYPARRSETQGNTVSSAIMSYSGSGVDDLRYEQIGRERRSHILIQHRRKKAVSYKMTERIPSPHPEGMSGGGVFAWSKSLPKPSGLGQPRLVGIITEYHESKHVFVATRLHLHLLMIQRDNPDLPISFVES